MPLASMQLAGSNAFVAWHLQRGYTADQTRAALRRRFPPELTGSINAAYNRGLQAYNAGQIVGQQGFAVAPGDVPSGGAAPSGYVYTVQMTLGGVALPGQAEPVRTIQVHSPGSLTGQELEDLVQDQGIQTLQDSSTVPGYGSQLAGAEVSGMFVLAVERGT